MSKGIVYTPYKEFCRQVATIRKGKEDTVIYNGPDGPVYYKDVWTKSKKKKSNFHKNAYKKKIRANKKAQKVEKKADYKIGRHIRAVKEKVTAAEEPERSWNISPGVKKSQYWGDNQGQIDPESEEIKALWAKFEANLKKSKK